MSFRRSRPAMAAGGLRSALAATLPVVLAVAGLLACGEPAAVEGPAPAGPLERAAYESKLAAAAGGEVSAERILARAGEAGRRIEERMELLARRLGDAGGWRRSFDVLRRETPPDETAVLELYRSELARAEAFVRGRRLVSLPPAPPEVVVLENPSLRRHFPLALYHGGRFAVTTRGGADEDPGYLANHCRVCVPPLAVHEGYPGHHVAFARMAGEDGAGPTVAELARFKPFVEGWGLYAELLMLEEGYYREPARELAAWRMLLLRVLRAEIDVRLHDAGGAGGGLAPAAAAALYRERLLVGAEAAAAEVRTHLAKPTVKASYFVGLLQLLELRRRVRQTDPGVDLRGFHDRLLGPPAPVPRIARERFGIELAPPGASALPLPAVSSPS